MAENDTEAPVQADEFPVSRMIEDSYRFFGVESHVAAGAFHGFKKKNATVDEGKKLIADFSKRKVG